MKTTPLKGPIMIKNLICSVVAFLLGTIFVTVWKDREILKLQKRVAHLNSYDYFSSIFRPAYEEGMRAGMHRCGVYPELMNHQN